MRLVNDEYQDDREINLYLAHLANSANESRKNPATGVEVYTDIHDRQKKGVKISQSKKQSNKCSKKTSRFVVGACVGLLMVATPVATKLHIGSENIKTLLNQSEAMEWFNNYYYIGVRSGSDHTIISKDTQEVADYNAVVTQIVDKMVNEEGRNVNDVAVYLDQLSISPRNVNEACTNLSISSSTFLERMKTCWDTAEIKEEDLARWASDVSVKGVSK